MELREEKALIKGIASNYKIKGEGKPVLVLHGWGGSSNSWLKVQNSLADNGFRVICPDFPGFGKSDAPKNAWNLDDYKNWTLELVKHLGLEKFYLLGHSFGGRVSVKLAAEHPQMIEKLILCDPAGVKIKPALKTVFIRGAAEAGNAFFNVRYINVFKDGVRSFFHFFVRNSDYAKAAGIMKEIMKNVLEEDVSPNFEKISAKTLIVWGQNDKIVPIKCAAYFKEGIKNSELKIIQRVGHNPHLESPGELSRIIFQFICITQ